MFFLVIIFQICLINAQSKKLDLLEVDLSEVGDIGKLLIKTQTNLRKDLDSAYYFLGIYALFSKNCEKTNQYVQQCFDIATDEGYQTFRLETNRIFAFTASYNNNKDLVLQYFLEALKYAKIMGEDISLRNNIAVLYIQADKRDLARSLHLEALSTMENDNKEDQFSLHTYTNLCVVSTSLKEVLLYISKALNIAQQLGYKEKELEVLIAKASHYKSYKKHHLAIPILEDVIQQAKLLNQKNYEYEATLLLVKYFAELGKYNQAKDYIKLVIELTESLPDKASLHELDIISFKVYTNANNYKEAVFYGNNYMSYLYDFRKANRDSLFLEYANKYETDKKNQENEILKKDNEIKSLRISKEKNRRNLFLAIAMIVLLGLVLMYYRYRYICQKKTLELLETKNQTITKQNIELKEANQTKLFFFSIIAHDLINPFNAIMGYTNLLENDFESFSNAEKQEFITIINKHTTYNYNLVKNLLDWARGQQNRISLNKTTLNIKQTVLHIIEAYSVLADKKQIQTMLHIDSNATLYADQDCLKTILTNLYSNAIKFSTEGSTITITVTTTETHTSLQVQDKGVGMTIKQINNLFSIANTNTSKGTNNEKGTGLGLLISKEFTELHKGTLNVKSEKNIGTEVTISFPTS